MGMFDLRCAISGLSTNDPHRWPAVRDAMGLLVREADGAWAPLAPPVIGAYDQYGGLRYPQGVDSREYFDGAHQYLEWLGRELEWAWLSDQLRTDRADLLEHARREIVPAGFEGVSVPSDTIPAFATVALAAQRAYNSARTEWSGREVSVWFFRWDIARKVCGPTTRPIDRIEEAFALPFVERVPESCRALLAQYDRAVRWSQSRGRVQPVGTLKNDVRQHSPNQVRFYIQRALEEPAPVNDYTFGRFTDVALQRR